jgi:hypothetical protein
MPLHLSLQSSALNAPLRSAAEISNLQSQLHTLAGDFRRD